MPRIINIVVGRKKGSTCYVEIASCAISAYDFSLFRDTNNRTWSWGRNDFSQLGDNSITQRNTPVSVAGTTKTFCQISAGTSHVVTIDKNGQAWVWGANNAYQLGDGSNINRCTPVSVVGTTKTFCNISAGAHSLAIDHNGRAWAWGPNYSGQLGDNSITDRCTPVSVLGATKTFCNISAGAHSLAIDHNGRAWAWGPNYNGQLGDNSITDRCTPVSVLGATKTFCKISAAPLQHTMVIDYAGRAWGWGSNRYGSIGDNSTTDRCTPVSVLGATKTFCEISAGGFHSAAIDKNGQAWSWGRNSAGQLGDNSITQRNTPVSVAGTTKTFCQIAAGLDHTIAVDKNANVWAWGSNYNGQLGDNSNSNKCTPISVLGATKTFCKIGVQRFHNIAIDKNGRAWGWGTNTFGYIGDNSTTDRCTPVSVLGATKTFCQIASGPGALFSCAIDKNGRAWSWGSNPYGQLGDNSVFSRRTPVSVAGAAKTFCQIAQGGCHTVAIDKNGRAWAWGLNFHGRLGDNSTTDRRTPVSVAGAAKTFCQIAGGVNYSAAIDKNGRAWAWGFNSSGQLGDNSVFSRRTPVSVAGTTKTFCQIAIGSFHTIVIDKNGRAWAWGYNANGELGDNSSTQRNTPVSVAGAAKTFCQIAGGGSHTVAIDKNGRAWAWGNNAYGQLGDNSVISRRTPVSVAGAAKTFCQIAGGGFHTVAIDKNGRSWAWGQVQNFALGNAYQTSKLTPVRVLNL